MKFLFIRCDFLKMNNSFLTHMITYQSHNTTCVPHVQFQGIPRWPSSLRDVLHITLKGASDHSAGMEAASPVSIRVGTESASCCSGDVFGVIFFLCNFFFLSWRYLTTHTHLTLAVMTGTWWGEINEGEKWNQVDTAFWWNRPAFHIGGIALGGFQASGCVSDCTNAEEKRGMSAERKGKWEHVYNKTQFLQTAILRFHDYRIITNDMFCGW